MCNEPKPGKDGNVKTEEKEKNENENENAKEEKEKQKEKEKKELNEIMSVTAHPLKQVEKTQNPFTSCLTNPYKHP